MTRGLSVALVNAPFGYPYMPHLGCYALAGHLRAHTSHRATVVDASGRYLHGTCAGSAPEAYLGLLARRARTAEIVEREFIEAFGRTAFDALRHRTTFADRDQVARSAAVVAAASRWEQASVASTLGAMRQPRRRGAWPEVLAAWGEAPVTAYLDRLVDEDPAIATAEVVGVSATYVEQLAPALLLAAAVRRRSLATRVVLGGGVVTHFLDDLSREPDLHGLVDAIVPFEGEVPFQRLLDAWATDGLEASAAHVRDVVHLGAGATRYRRSLVPDRAPPSVPAYDLIEDHFPTPVPVVPLLTSEGCYWGKCAYCTHHEGYGNGFRRRPDDHVEQSIRQAIAATGSSSFYFVDEALPPRKLADFAERFHQMRGEGTDVRWMTEARVERSTATEEAAELMRASGCALVVNGVETGSQRVADLMRKGTDLAAVRQAALHLRRRGVAVGWMFFVGFPGETLAEARETFALIRAFQDTICFAAVGAFQLERGAPIWNDPEAFGIERVDEPDGAYREAHPYRSAAEPDRVRTYADGAALLEQLLLENADLEPVLSAAVDRALAFFLAVEGTALQERPEVRSSTFTFRSRTFDAPVVVDAGAGTARLGIAP